jgi:hypothetical protein
MHAYNLKPKTKMTKQFPAGWPWDAPSREVNPALGALHAQGQNSTRVMPHFHCVFMHNPDCESHCH